MKTVSVFDHDKSFTEFHISVPEQVPNITVTILNSSTVRVHWSSPLIPNGVIIYYELKIYVLDDLVDTFNSSSPGINHVVDITLGKPVFVLLVNVLI